MKSPKKIWLMKTEPEVFSIEDLRRQKESLWEGVRNYQARNFMTQAMAPGDLVLVYHSSADPSGVAGLGCILKKSEADPTQFDSKSDYFDPKSKRETPRWHCVTVGFREMWSEVLPLTEIRNHKPLKNMLLLRPGQRLSIQPVLEEEFQEILRLKSRLGIKTL